MSYFYHKFKNIPCYVMSEVSLKRFYFALFDDGLTLKTLKLAFIGFLIQTLHMYVRQKNWQCECFACSRQKGMNEKTPMILKSY